MGQSKLLKFTVLGALAGATISMLNRKTREHTIATTKKALETVSYYGSNRDELQILIEEKFQGAQSLCENLSNKAITFIEAADGFEDVSETIQA